MEHGRTFAGWAFGTCIFAVIVCGCHTSAVTSIPVPTAQPGGNIYVADQGANTVKEMLASTGYASIRSIGSGFASPQRIATDAFENVYVPDEGNDAVKEILASDGYATVRTLGAGFKTPVGVAVDESGNIYVAEKDSSIHWVLEIVAVGGSIPSSPTVKTLGGGFNSLSDVAVDGFGECLRRRYRQ